MWKKRMFFHTFSHQRKPRMYEDTLVVLACAHVMERAARLAVVRSSRFRRGSLGVLPRTSSCRVPFGPPINLSQFKGKHHVLLEFYSFDFNPT